LFIRRVDKNKELGYLQPMRFKRVLLLVLALSLFPLSQGLSAHPHLRLFNRFEIVWEGQKLNGMWLEWTFDDFFSSDIIQAYDYNCDKKFNAKETQAVFANAFAYISEYYYFTFIRVGEKRYNPNSVSRFSARVSGNKLVYRFYVELSAYQSKDLYLSVYDYTFFCDIPYQQERPVSFQYDPALVKPSYSAEENKKYPIYYNPLGTATDTTIYYKWKKGLMTFYPKEIHLSYELLEASHPPPDAIPLGQ
jgi:ABC-type uncharacterized transport system substrate-binding protein